MFFLHSASACTGYACHRPPQAMQRLIQLTGSEIQTLSSFFIAQKNYIACFIAQLVHARHRLKLVGFKSY